MAEGERRRCLYCRHWKPDDENPEAVEREAEMRHGPEVAIAGLCIHPDHPKLWNRVNLP